MEQTLIRIEELLQSSREKHERIQAIKDELSRNKELTTIFSKELMVVALQDFLPNLESVINTFLDGVVDYQIRFLTPESISDTLELDIEIHDHHGVRQVKSLS
jgi:DNA repair exonuclease SbcCD ATPase subunit